MTILGGRQDLYSVIDLSHPPALEANEIKILYLWVIFWYTRWEMKYNHITYLENLANTILFPFSCSPIFLPLVQYHHCCACYSVDISVFLQNKVCCIRFCVLFSLFTPWLFHHQFLLFLTTIQVFYTWFHNFMYISGYLYMYAIFKYFLICNPFCFLDFYFLIHI